MNFEPSLKDKIRQLEAQLEEARRKVEFQQHVVDGVPAMIAYWDQDKCCQFANQSYFDWFGFHPNQLIGMNIRDVLGVENYEKNTGYIEGALRGERQEFERFLTKRLTGETRQVQAVYAPDWRSGQVLGFFVIVTDITKLKTAESARNDALSLAAELGKSLKMRERFLAVASHELKTPMTTLKLRAQLAMKILNSVSEPDVRSWKKIAEIISSDEVEVDRLVRLVNDMLDVSRIAAGRFTIIPERVDLVALVRKVITRFEPMAKGAGVDIFLEADGTGFEVWGLFDSQRIEQAVGNLISNAIKYGAGKPVQVYLSVDGGFVKISVRDEGLGILPRDQKRIFQPFERAISENEISGLGIGLYVVDEIVRTHGGEVILFSEAGKGSMFTIRLPLTGG